MLAANLLKNPVFWEVAGWLAFLIVGGLFIASDFRHRLSRWQQLGLLVVLVGLLVTNRLLLLFFNRELNPDESQMLSQAITLWHHPVYWRSTDGATMGPLSSYFASIPAYWGSALDYLAIRRTGFLCLLVSVITGYFTLENFFRPRTARLALLPGVAFLAFAYQLDFLHATNEQLSLALLGLAFWQYSRLWKRQSFDSVSGLFVLGFICSLVPFAKLQGAPPALVIAAAALIGLLGLRKRLDPAQFWVAFGGLLAGGLAFPLLVVFLTWQFEVFDDFLQFYLFGNLNYSAGASFWDYLLRFPVYVYHNLDFLFFLIQSFALLLGWVLFSEGRKKHNGLLIFALASIITAGYAVIKPGNEFGHYLLYLIFPVCLLNAWLIDSLQAPFHTLVWVLLILVSIGIKSALQRGDLAKEPLNALRQQPFGFRTLFVSTPAREILKYARPGEDLVVWGWAPTYNIQTQMPQGVADNHTIRCMLGSPEAQSRHRARYLRNIQTSRPPVFADAVGPNSFWLNNRATQGYENFPELKRFIDANYRYIGDVENTRIYVRTDRYQQP
ncbi:hypothetical protein LX87_02681 [Larkinella arboricola]|uniref:Dolichyl-phosphate-mannose-protein mannosyltransferase n=1 Tax=Larkinella arboricola TaxID=643671 RepID=A0A327WYF7_LARAB|nr:hypothetical protein [Larkinella arboricola]RAJ97776.1 hypothetical protein LX87_02681 [Larkinella arboricola]